MVQTDRRAFLKTGIAGTVLTALVPTLGRASVISATPLSKVLDSFAGDYLKLSPETATGLGLDTGVYTAEKSKLSDLSPTTDKAFTALANRIKTQLRAIDPKTLSDADKLERETLLYVCDACNTGAGFAYGQGARGGFYGGAAPYVITQQDGAVTQVPEFLNSQHQIKTAADAEAYLERVSAFARALDQETSRLTGSAAIGVMPPDFIATNASGQLKGYRATQAAQQGLVTSLVTRTKAAGIAGDWANRCIKLIEETVYPALDRQIIAFDKSVALAPHTAGVQRLPDGEAYYAWALGMGTTTNTPAADIHALGLEQNKEIKDRLDGLLKKQGLTQGTVGERVVALNSDPRFLYPNTDEGRAQLIAYLNECVERIRPMMAKMSHMDLKAALQIKRVPVDIQDGAALGYMNFASLDGSRPAIYYVNLKSTSLWPKYQLPTLTAHEGIPGHAWQGAYLAEHHAEIPLANSITGFNAFVEGWALYAEQLVGEFGLYDNDPFGEIGYLQAQQFRACRLVADTGLHSMGWSREQTVEFLTLETGKGKDAMTSETDRYCASPGQACGYKMGHNEILRLRANAMTKLGAKFDLPGFNDTVVKTCGVPLSLLPMAIDSWIAQVQKA